ncbi:hypothetical protein WJX74_001410 [Apatococcus lobatus]|uniref:Uncharacterized protein n=1 Tax=Apatococcus lobatus TaxID=904363 RepID=A0AAW1Q924_9CHLO
MRHVSQIKADQIVRGQLDLHLKVATRKATRDPIAPSLASLKKTKQLPSCLSQLHNKTLALWAVGRKQARLTMYMDAHGVKDMARALAWMMPQQGTGELQGEHTPVGSPTSLLLTKLLALSIAKQTSGGHYS